MNAIKENIDSAPKNLEPNKRGTYICLEYMLDSFKIDFWAESLQGNHVEIHQNLLELDNMLYKSM